MEDDNKLSSLKSDKKRLESPRGVHLSSKRKSYADNSSMDVSVESELFNASTTTTAAPLNQEQPVRLRNISEHCFVLYCSTRKECGCLCVFTENSAEVAVRGKLRISCVNGVVQIMGYQLDASLSHGEQYVFSPNSHSLLTFLAVKCRALKTKSLLRNVLLNDVFGGEASVTQIVDRLQQELAQLQRTRVCVMLCRNLHHQALDSIGSFYPYRSLWQLDLQARSRRREWNTFNFLALTSVERYLTEPESCKEIAKRATAADGSWRSSDNQSSRIALCGGSNLGKSTSLRILLNRALQSPSNCNTGVALLDLDPGQTECTPASFLTLTLHHKPLFGPPFSHQSQCGGGGSGTLLRMVFLGALSPAEDPQHYVRCVQTLWEAYMQLESEKRPPLIVNTMGWPNGLGLLLTCHALRLVQPHFLIQLEGDKPERNFPRLLTPDYVNGTDSPHWTSGKDWHAPTQPCCHQLITAAAQHRPATGRYSPADHRDLSLLANLLSACRPRFPRLVDLLPFKLLLSDIALLSCGNSRPADLHLMLMTVNASVVTLARVPPAELLPPLKNCLPLQWRSPTHVNSLTSNSKPLCHCFGIGVVRAVEPNSEAPCLWLISPLSENELAQVNLVLRGSLTLPACLLLENNGTACGPAQPYVGDEKLVSGFGVLNLPRERSHVYIQKH